MKFPAFKISAGLFTILAFVAPISVSAQSVAAGFAPGSLWLSSTSLAAGDQATLYTVAYDSSQQSVAGDVVFTIDGTTLGTQHFALSPGTTQVVSLPWTATLGSHTFGATMENMNAGDVVLPEASSETVSVVIAAPPAPSAGVAAAEQAASGISSAAPVTLTLVRGALGTVQSVRSAAETAIENTLAADTVGTSSAAAAAAGQVLGTSTERVATTSEDVNWKTLVQPSSLGSYFSTVWRAVLSAALFILTNDWLFWIVLILVLYIVFRLLLLVFRERRRR